MKYMKRYADVELEEALNLSGAVLIEGPKFCGKTETAKRFANTVYQIDTDENIPNLLKLAPQKIFEGKTPILYDEWQEQPKIWNLLRHEVDRRKLNNQFILTGSANPQELVKLHSGAGRINKIKLNTMSLAEAGISSGAIALESLFISKALESFASEVELDELINMLIVGGWPALLGANQRKAALYLQSYVNLIAEVDLSRVSNKKRDPTKVKQLLKSYARNVGTLATIETLVADTKAYGQAVNRDTIADYLEALSRLMLINEIPAWTQNIRSTIPLRNAKKRYFSDPSLAVAILGLSEKSLMSDLNFAGFLFENLVIKDLEVYSRKLNAQIYHYRDAQSNEVDVIIAKNTGDYIAIEIKLGFLQADDAAKSLLKFESLVSERKPISLNIITGNGFSHTRADGINVIPVGVLG